MSKQGNHRRNKKAKKESLTQLSAILKGIVVYRTEVAEMKRLCEKYPEEVPYRYMGAQG